ncbi:MAG: molybdopterin-dependent oxidoreductase [Sporomusaceae bacterium]|nr:molybdopterin-dependent oxidoreductase [Sporomusaceae bacterium]
MIHALYALQVVILLISGWLLSSPALRGSLSEFHIYFRDAHVSTGFLLVVSMIGIVWGMTRNISRSRSISYPLAVLLSITMAVTGMMLVFGMDFGGQVSVHSLHRYNAWTVTVALLLHVALGYLFGKQEILSEKQIADNKDRMPVTNRRLFINWLIALGAIVGIGSITKLLQGDNAPRSEGMSVQYKDCNNMQPPPVPSLGSLPPIGGGHKGKFEVFTVTEIPCSHSGNWQFVISGLVESPLELTWKQFLDLPRKVQVSNFHCITGWSVYDVTYEGVSISALLEAAGAKPDGRFIKFTSSDGVYTSALSIEQAMMSDVMMAVLMDGEPIPSSLGGPVRLIVPQMYAYKGVKWLTAIEVLANPYMGFWETRGYKNDAWVSKK